MLPFSQHSARLQCHHFGHWTFFFGLACFPLVQKFGKKTVQVTSPKLPKRWNKLKQQEPCLFFDLCVFESFLRRKTRHPKASTTLNDFRSSGAKGGRLLRVCFQNYDLTCLGSHAEKTPLVRT